MLSQTTGDAGMNKTKEKSVMSVDAATVHDWIETDQALLVDVRETSEFDKEHIPGAMLLPLSAFDPELFPTVPGKKVVLHCAVGKRSETAGKMLLNEGHNGIIHMTGGLEEWKKAGFETEIPYHPPTPEKTPEPVFLCPPVGEVLQGEYLAPLKLTGNDLADAVAVSYEIIDGVLEGKTPVTAELSLRFARYFSTAADFWLQLQSDHDLERARYKIGAEIKNKVRPRVAP
jgi:addiction module HigA family antidote